MPEGSIRALIAMSLILMFAIIGVTVLYSGMGGEPIESNGISAAEIERLENVQIISISVVDPAASPGAERFNVTARPELSQAGHDFGLQLLTTVSTLVVAVAGFYFGSRAVAQGAKTARPRPRRRRPSPRLRAPPGQRPGRSSVARSSRRPTDRPTTERVDETNVAPLGEDELVGAVEDVSDDAAAPSGRGRGRGRPRRGPGGPVVNGGKTEDDLPPGSEKPPAS